MRKFSPLVPLGTFEGLKDYICLDCSTEQQKFPPLQKILLASADPEGISCGWFRSASYKNRAPIKLEEAHMIGCHVGQQTHNKTFFFFLS